MPSRDWNGMCSRCGCEPSPAQHTTVHTSGAGRTRQSSARCCATVQSPAATSPAATGSAMAAAANAAAAAGDRRRATAAAASPLSSVCVPNPTVSQWSCREGGVPGWA